MPRKSATEKEAAVLPKTRRKHGVVQPNDRVDTARVPVKATVAMQRRKYLSPRQREFCTQFVMNGGMPKQSAVAAGYPDASASVTAYRLLRQRHIRELIDELRQENYEAYRASRDFVISTLREIATDKASFGRVQALELLTKIIIPPTPAASTAPTVNVGVVVLPAENIHQGAVAAPSSADALRKFLPAGVEVPAPPKPAVQVQVQTAGFALPEEAE